MTPPRPPDEADCSRWDITAGRVRMVDGKWLQDAEEAIRGWFAVEIQLTLPRPELSRNPLLAFVNQIATLYDHPYRVAILDKAGKVLKGGEGSVDGPMLSQQQDLLRYVVACNDCPLRMDVADTGEITYRVVTADMVFGVSDKADPSQFGMVTELREREIDGKPIWTWERWDVRSPAAPEFKVFIRNEQGDEEDLTEAVTGASGWPEWARDKATKAPVLPYVLYHRFVAPRLWTPTAGTELIAGTLTSSCIWTSWLAGFRDAGFPPRAIVDGIIEGGTAVRGGGVAVEHHVLNPMAVLSVRSRDGQKASLSQWGPGMDPKTGGEAVAQFDEGLAVSAGLSPADVSRGSNGASGYSIVVSRDGQRRMQAKLRVPMAMGDQLRLAKAAALTGSAAPTDPTRYAISYAPILRSPEEMRADLLEVTGLFAAGLCTRVYAYMRMHPDATEEQAEAALAKIDAEKARAADEEMARQAKFAPPQKIMPPSRGMTQDMNQGDKGGSDDGS